MNSRRPVLDDNANVYVVCPRKKTNQHNYRDAKNVVNVPVQLTLQMLQPYFTKPLTQVSEELGLSATAIKKACRKFGVPKWPFRTLTAKSSRNRDAMNAMAFTIDALPSKTDCFRLKGGDQCAASWRLAASWKSATQNDTSSSTEVDDSESDSFQRTVSNATDLSEERDEWDEDPLHSLGLDSLDDERESERQFEDEMECRVRQYQQGSAMSSCCAFFPTESPLALCDKDLFSLNCGL